MENKLYKYNINKNELMHSDVYLGKDYSDGLQHWKYISKEFINGKWRYYYTNRKGKKKDLRLLSAASDFVGEDERENLRNESTRSTLFGIKSWDKYGDNTTGTLNNVPASHLQEVFEQGKRQERALNAYERTILAKCEKGQQFIKRLFGKN